MPQFYAEILRGVAWRDNNFKPLASNDPSTSTLAWPVDAGVTATSDGDVLTFSGSDATHGIGKTGRFPQVSTTTYPWLVVRAKGDAARTLHVQAWYADATHDDFTMSLTTSWQTFSFQLTAGKTTGAPWSYFLNQSSAGNNYVDYSYLCSSSPIQLSQKDLKNGTVTRGARGDIDHAELVLNNHRGKFVAGSGLANAIGYGDHLHIYLGQAATLYHVYGGYVEYEEPVQPTDEMILNSRGFGLALSQTIVQNQPTASPIYTSSTPRTIVNDFIDNHVNNSNKNGTGISSNYQITRSFVQNIGSSIPLYIVNFKTVADSMREISDLTVSQGTPATFWVDPAENLHLVPLGQPGAANWTTDPVSANYGTGLTLGTNLAMYRFRRDVQSLKNRVHYYAVAQSPGQSDAWTENNASSWGAQAANGDFDASTTATFTNESSIIAQGGFSIKCVLADSAQSSASKAMFYPSAKNLALDINSLGSINSPPIFDFYFRVHQGSNPKVTTAGKSPYIFFGTDTGGTMTDYFKYNLIADGGQNALNSILGIQGINNATDDYWYHIMLPIGPHGGVVWNPTPVANTVAPAIYTGTSAYTLSSQGSPDWKNINYIGMFWQDGGGAPPTYSAPFYFDGWRILGGRYYIAYDNRAAGTPYPDMREIHFYDPVSKDESAIKNFALSELKRLWNPIVRGTVTTPLLADAWPEQQVQVTTASANYSSTYLRITSIVHRFSQQAYMTEFALCDDFTNTQMLDQWKLPNALLQMGENAFFSRELYDLKSAILDPSFVPILVHP